MKCRMTEKRNTMIMTAVGVFMIALGAAAGLMLPDEEHLLVRLAGVVTGAGTAFAVIGAGILLWRGAVGKERAAESEMAMQDERGQMIAYKAQNVMAFAAVISLIVVELTALMRGDRLYMLLCACLCLLSAAAKVIAMRVYDKRM